MNHFGFPILELFNLSTIKGYKVIEAEIEPHVEPNISKEVMNANSVFYNSLVMDLTSNLGNCQKDMDFLELIEAAATAVG